MLEQAIKTEMRLFAVETLVCQVGATLLQLAEPEVFTAMREQAKLGAQRQTFKGFDAAYSDLLSAELEAAIDRLYGMIESHLEKAKAARSPR